MAVVKGSKQQKLMVVSYDPWGRFWKRLFILALIASLAFASYLFGRYEALEAQEQAIAERDQLRLDLKAANEEIADYTQRVVVLEKGGEVDRRSTEGLRQNMVDLRSQIASLQEEVAFYKGLMAPSSRKPGLRIQNVEVSPSLEKRRFSYKAVFTQVGSNQTYISGLAAVNVTGVLNGQQKTYALRDLDEKVNDFGIKFRFRYFQEIQGDIKLPDGFEPEEIEVVLQSKGSKASRVKNTFPWPGKEEKSVGQ